MIARKRSRALLKAEADYFGIIPAYALLMWEVTLTRPKTRDIWYNYHLRHRRLAGVDPETGRFWHAMETFEDGKMGGGAAWPIRNAAGEIAQTPEEVDWVEDCDSKFPAERLDDYRAKGWTVDVWIHVEPPPLRFEQEALQF